MIQAIVAPSAPVACPNDAGHALLFESLQILHQATDREVRRITLAVVTELLADLERRYIRDRQRLAFVSAAFEYRAEHVVVLPGHAANQDGDFAAFGRGERAFHGKLELLLDIYQPGGSSQPGSLRLQLL